MRFDVELLPYLGWLNENHKSAIKIKPLVIYVLWYVLFEKCETQNRWSLVATLTVYKEARFVCVFIFWCVESDLKILKFRNCPSDPLCVCERERQRERESNTSTTPPKGSTPKYITITDDLLITFRKNQWKVGGSWLMTLLMLWSSNLLMHTNSCFATPADMVVCVLKDWGTYLMDKY